VKELPRGWAWTTLGEACEVTQGQSPPGASYNAAGMGVPFFQGKADFGELHPTPRNWCSAPKKLAEAGDILISIRAPVGPTNIAAQRCCIGRGLAALRTRDDIHQRYVLYWLRLSEPELSQRASGSTFASITGTQLAAHPLPLAPVAEQRRIVAEIEKQTSRLDYATVFLGTVENKLAAASRAILRKTSERSDPLATDCCVGDASECLDRQRIPVNAEERKKRLGSIPYLGANGQVGWIDKPIFKEPLVLVVEDETFVGRTKPFAYRVEGPSWVNNHAHVLRPKPNISLRYLHYALMYYPFTPLTTGSTGRRKLTQKALMAAPLNLPNPEEQHRRVESLDRWFSIAEQLSKSIGTASQCAARLRQAILKKAFEGKLVPQDPNDEPASVLLERIRAARAHSSARARAIR
jgi:type I restriction enzyme S subunit